MQQALLFLLAIVAGVMLPIQAGLNSEMAKAVKSPLFGTLISFVVGTLGLLLFLLLARANWSDLKEGFTLPWYYWTGGILGIV
ncbi:MAG: DMT family transporter, partial [Bacteroidota bacterium]